MVELPILTLPVGIALVSVVLAYMTVKSYQFQRPAEIRESVQQNFNDFRVHENAGLMYRATRVLAEKPGFPERLYKYLPKIRREGFVEIEFIVEPSPGEDSVILPSPAEIEAHDLFPVTAVEIRQAKWSNSPIQNTSILLRVYAFNDRKVVNAAYAAMTSIVEVKTGETNRELHANFKHTEIDISEQDSTK